MNTKLTVLCMMVVGTIGSSLGGAIVPSSMLTHVSVRGTNDVVDFYSPTPGMPSSGALSASGQDVSASANYSFSDAGFVISDVAYSLGARNNKSSFAEVYGTIIFTPQFDTEWELSGDFTWAGSWLNGFTLFARIQDTATETEVTRHYYQTTGVESSASLTVGSGTGNTFNVIGPTSGTLLAGIEYEYMFDLAVDNNMYSPQTGTALGDLALTLVVPEPATMLMLGIGGLVLRAHRRR